MVNPLKIIAPGLYRWSKFRLKTAYYRWRQPGCANAVRRLTWDVFDASNGVVLDGPFKGMRYRFESCGSTLLPKVVGSYEQEIRSWIDEIVSAKYTRIIDIGCGEGYYAVGFALFCNSRPQVFAYDIDPAARMATQSLASLNQLHDTVHVGAMCSPEELAAKIDQSTLVFCDIEGAELSLLDPAQCKALLKCDLLVECHDGEGRGDIRTILEDRFSATHRVRRVSHGYNRTEVLPKLPIDFPSRWAMAILDEDRHLGMDWLFIQRLAT